MTGWMMGNFTGSCQSVSPCGAAVLSRQQRVKFQGLCVLVSILVHILTSSIPLLCGELAQ